MSAPAANTPQVITVILTVLPAGSTLGPQVFPTGLIFTGVAGVTPGSQDVQLAIRPGQVNSYQSGVDRNGLQLSADQRQHTAQSADHAASVSGLQQPDARKHPTGDDHVAVHGWIAVTDDQRVDCWWRRRE